MLGFIRRQQKADTSLEPSNFPLFFVLLTFVNLRLTKCLDLPHRSFAATLYYVLTAWF